MECNAHSVSKCPPKFWHIIRELLYASLGLFNDWNKPFGSYHPWIFLTKVAIRYILYNRKLQSDQLNEFWIQLNSLYNNYIIWNSTNFCVGSPGLNKMIHVTKLHNVGNFIFFSNNLVEKIHRINWTKLTRQIMSYSTHNRI